jgi:hypothetical protein
MDGASPIAPTARTTDAEFAGEAYAATVAALARTIATGEPARPRSRRRFALRVAAIAVAAIAIPVASAVGYGISAHTGLFGSPGMTENDTTEWLRTDAPDFGRVAARLVPNLPLPAGASWRDEVRNEVRIGRSAPGLVQVTGVRSDFEAYARCSWVQAWVNAYLRDDAAKAAHTAAVIARSADWPALAATDGGGTRAHVRALATAARHGDVGHLRTELALNCDGFNLARVQ